MATQPTQEENLLYLDEITLRDVPNREYTLRLFVGNVESILLRKDNRTWTPVQRLDVSPTSEVCAEIQMKSGHSVWTKYRQKREVVDLQGLFNDYWASKKHKFTVPTVVVVGKHSWSFEVQFLANVTAESLRSWLHELEGLLENFSPLMKGSTERVLGTVLNFGVALSELNPISKLVAGVASATFELLKEQNKYDQIPAALFDRLQRLLPLADTVVYEYTEVLEKVILQMFEVIQRVAKFTCDYVRRGFFKRTVGGLVHPAMIEELYIELNKVIEDFDRAVKIEVLRLAQKNELLEEDLLLRPLIRAETGYNRDQCCMEGTRQSLLNQIIAWATNKSGHNDESNTYWIYGSPGIGKTALAHSICASFHDREQLAGAFFCRRDDPHLSEARNILPTLVYKLARMFPPFRKIVAERLRNDPNMTPESMEHSLFLDLIGSLPSPHHPERTLVLVIDALDECGSTQSRPGILSVLTSAATQAPWLKIIITSRPETDIQHFFDAPTQSSHLQCNLATDQASIADLRKFAQTQFDLVASKWYLPTPWPEESLFNRLISLANGLFIFIKTLFLALENCADPKQSLEAILQVSAGIGLSALYGLYSSILKARVLHNDAEFRRMVGVLLATAPNRSLCEETIAELAGVRANLVKKWVDDLSSLLYRDEEASGRIRVRHLSVSDFFISDACHLEYRINLGDANVRLGISCLKVMIGQLRFNICGLEDSRLANADVKDLQTRIKQNISDSLQYGSLHWSNHLCFIPDNGDQCAWGSLKEFFEGLYPLFWIEVLSVMGMVHIGAPSLRTVMSWTKDANSTVIETIRDLCRFIIAFRTPLSLSTPHTYISTGPFLPSQSPLSTIFDTRFKKAIKMHKGKALFWPVPPLKWIGHADAVTCIGCSPNGRVIISGSIDKTIRIWDAETGSVVGEPLKGHTDDVWSVACSPDGRYIISASSDNTIRIWDAETAAAVGKPLEGHSGSVNCVAYSPDGRRIVSGSTDKTVRIWDADTGTAVGGPLEGHTRGLHGVAYSPNGRHIISGSADRTIRIWDAETGAIVGQPLEGHNRSVCSVAYSPDGRHVVSGSADKTVRIWGAETGTAVGEPLVGHTDVVRCVAYSPDGQHIVSGSHDSTIRIWDAKTGLAIGKPITGHIEFVRAIAYSPDGRYIISASGDRTIRIWDAKTGGAVGEPPQGPTWRFLSVAYSPDGLQIIAGCSDRTIRIWDAETGVAICKPLEGHVRSVKSVAYSPNGRRIVSGSSDSSIRIWDARTGAAIDKPLQGHTDQVDAVAYSPNGQRVISGSCDGTIRIWDAETGAAVGKPLEGHTGYVRAVAYSPDGRHIISGSGDGTIRTWDAETGAVVGKPLEGHAGWVESVAYSSDGKHIISGSSDNTIRTWDAKSGAEVIQPLEGHVNNVRSVAYSPSGQYIASGSFDGTIRIWDARTGVAVGRPLRGHTDSVWSIAYSPNGQYIVSGSDDGTIRVWRSFSHPSDHIPSVNAMHPNFCAEPDPDGWVRDSDNDLLYWIPPDYRAFVHSPALLTISVASHTKLVSLDFEDFAYGTSWVQIFSSLQS